MSEISSNGVTAVEETVQKSPLKAPSEEAQRETSVIKSPVKTPVKNGNSATNSPAKNGSATSGATDAVASSEETKETIADANKSPVKTDATAEATAVDKTENCEIKTAGISPAKADASAEAKAADETENEEIKATTKTTDKSPAKNDNKAEDVEDDSDKSGEYFLARGKRDLTIRDYPSAVLSLATACEKLSAVHGEFGDELGDAYFFYGKALLASHREEAGALGDKIENQEGEGESDDDEEEEDNGTEGKSEEVASEDTPAEEKKTTENGAAEEGAEGSAENGEAEAEPEGDADDLQLSWQFLEMAKVIFDRKAGDDKEIAIKLSEVYLTLGENGLESESCTTALADFESCLELQKKTMAADDRRIAETLYQMGMANGMMEKYEEAVVQFEASVAQLQKRLDTLEAAKKAGKKHPDDDVYDSFYSLESEKDDITETIKEIRYKIADMQDSQKSLKEELVKRLMGVGTGASSSSAGESSSSSSAFGTAPTSSSTSNSSSTATDAPTAAKPISNISHLVRKKRKNEDEPEKEDKRPKTDESSQ